MRVGLEFRALLPLLPILPNVEDQKEFETQLAEHFSLQRYIDAGLLKSYTFYWQEGQLRRIHLIPHSEVRRTPGIERLKELFMGAISYNAIVMRKKRARKKRRGIL